LLKLFCEPGGPGAGLQLIAHNLEFLSSKPIAAGGAGSIENFVQIDSAATELVWKQVEDRLSAAIMAAENGTIFAQADLVTTLRNAVALHYVRNTQTLEVHRRSFDRACKQQKAVMLRDRELCEQAFRRTYGLEPAGYQDIELGAEAMQADLKKLFQQGALFRLRVQVECTAV
jgi:hypothetical protein